MILRICFCKQILRIKSCGNNGTGLALKLLSFSACKPDRKFDGFVFILGAFVYSIAQTVDAVVFDAVEGRHFYTVDHIFDDFVFGIFFNHIRTSQGHSDLTCFEHSVGTCLSQSRSVWRQTSVDHVDPALNTFLSFGISVTGFRLVIV